MDDETLDAQAPGSEESAKSEAEAREAEEDHLGESYLEADHLTPDALENFDGFIPFRDADRILNAGTIVKIGGVDCKFLFDVPVEAVLFRDEQVFVEHLVQENPANLAANAEGLEHRYNAHGVRIPEEEKAE